MEVKDKGFIFTMEISIIAKDEKTARTAAQYFEQEMGEHFWECPHYLDAAPVDFRLLKTAPKVRKFVDENGKEITRTGGEVNIDLADYPDLLPAK